MLTSFFLVMFPFRFPQKDGAVPRNKCQLSAYGNSLPIQAVTLSVLHSLLQGHPQAEARPPSCPGLSIHALAQLPHGAVAGAGWGPLWPAADAKLLVLCTNCGWQGFRPEYPTGPAECGGVGEPGGAEPGGAVVAENPQEQGGCRGNGKIHCSQQRLLDSHRENEEKLRKSRMWEGGRKAI